MPTISVGSPKASTIIRSFTIPLPGIPPPPAENIVDKRTTLTIVPIVSGMLIT